MFFYKQKTAYEMRISDWSSDVCSSDLIPAAGATPGSAFRGILSNGTKSYLVSARPVASSSAGAQTSAPSDNTSGDEPLLQPDQEPSPTMVEPTEATESGAAKIGRAHV